MTTRLSPAAALLPDLRHPSFLFCARHNILLSSCVCQCPTGEAPALITHIPLCVFQGPLAEPSTPWWRQLTDHITTKDEMTIYLSKTIFAASQSILISRPTVAFYVAVVPSRCLGFIWLRCHFMPASPPLPAKEHYFLSHSKDCHCSFDFLKISKLLLNLWMCLPRTLLMICCDTFCLAFQRVFHLLRDLFWIQFTECSARVDATWGCEGVKVCPGPHHPCTHTGCTVLATLILIYRLYCTVTLIV